MLLKMIAYRRNFDETKYISFLKKENKMLERFKEISNKFSNSIKKGFQSKPVSKN